MSKNHRRIRERLGAELDKYLDTPLQVMAPRGIAARGRARPAAVAMIRRPSRGTSVIGTAIEIEIALELAAGTAPRALARRHGVSYTSVFKVQHAGKEAPGLPPDFKERRRP